MTALEYFRLIAPEYASTQKQPVNGCHFLGPRPDGFGIGDLHDGVQWSPGYNEEQLELDL